MTTPWSRHAAGAGKAPRLILRFGVYAAIAMIAAAVAAYFFVRHYATTGAEADAQDHTSYVANAVLGSELTRSDFRGDASGARLERLDRITHQQLLKAGVVRVKLYDPEGTVVYASEHGLIGTRPTESDEVEEAFDGNPTSDLTTLDAEGGEAPDRKILESYVPLRLDGQTAGVLELYSDYGVIARDAREIFLPVAIGIAIVLLALYLSFFPILRRVRRTLASQLEEIEAKAYTDDLTGLPNRTAFADRIAEAIPERGEERFAVLLLDLDRFRDVNDTLGHASGDRLLEALAADLEGAMRPTDTVARLGGDEFGILARRISDPSAVLALAEKLRGVLGTARTLDGVALEVDAGIGIALHPEHGDDALTLLRHADIALDRGKELHAPALYEPSQDRFSPERLGLLAELRRALGERELVVHYQPQHEPARGHLVSVEALVRWQHPARGLLLPGEFVPAAEHTGLIRDLTRYVLDESLAQARRWHEAGLELPVAVNISPTDLMDATFPAEVEELLARHRVAPARLELEVTENSAIANLGAAGDVLSRLHRIGVRLAIDDFGTGNSSLAYFRHLPIDVLKIDRGFVMRMDAVDDEAAIVHSTITLAHDLGLEVIAEGVESAAANARLAAWGCDLVQGFLYSPAVPPEEVAVGASQV